MGNAEARVEVLTAEVRALMVGKRQVTLSVYRQLDTVEPDEIEPFGRVRDSQDDERYWCVVGRHRLDGTLVRSRRPLDPGKKILLPGSWSRMIYHNVQRDQARAEIIILTDGDMTVYVDAVSCFRSSVVDPGTWGYVEGAKAQVQNLAQRAVAEARDAARGAAEWSALPLIVLAGLR